MTKPTLCYRCGKPNPALVVTPLHAFCDEWCRSNPCDCPRHGTGGILATDPWRSVFCGVCFKNQMTFTLYEVEANLPDTSRDYWRQP